MGMPDLAPGFTCLIIGWFVPNAVICLSIFDLRGSAYILGMRPLNRLMRIYGGEKEKVAHIAGISVRSLYRKLQQGLTEQG